jgi:hypothetical protein
MYEHVNYACWFVTTSIPTIQTSAFMVNVNVNHSNLDSAIIWNTDYQMFEPSVPF